MTTKLKLRLLSFACVFVLQIWVLLCALFAVQNPTFHIKLFEVLVMPFLTFYRDLVDTFFMRVGIF